MEIGDGDGDWGLEIGDGDGDGGDGDGDDGDGDDNADGRTMVRFFVQRTESIIRFVKAYLKSECPWCSVAAATFYSKPNTQRRG